MFFKRKNQKPIETIRNLQKILSDESESIRVCMKAAEIAKNEGCNEAAQLITEVLKDEKMHKLKVEQMLINLRS